MAQLNVLIMGKSGAGKSTLMNYLTDSDLAKANAGRPQTEMGIFPYPPIHSNGIDLVFSDTWGLEADKAVSWSKTILDVANHTELNQDINSWYHCAIYCISAKGARLEDFEINSIINPLLERGTAVIIALTKSDIASEDEKMELKKSILDKTSKSVEIVEISSESKALRNGTMTQKFGKDLLLETMSGNIRTNLVNKLKGMFFIKSDIYLRNLKETLTEYFEAHDGKFVLASEISSQIDTVSKLAVENYFLNVEYWLLHNIMQARLIFISFGNQFHLTSTIADSMCFYQENFKMNRKFGDAKRPINVGFKGIDNINSLNRAITEFTQRTRTAAEDVATLIQLN